MLVPLSILFGALLTVVTAFAIGRTILRRTCVELYRGEEDALAFVLGSAVLSGLVFAISALGIARRGVFLAIAAAAILVAVRRGAHRNVRPRFKPLPRFWRNLFFAGFTVFTVLYFFSAMAPEFSPDGVSYHLSFVARYAREHGFVRIPWNLYAQLSQGIELLYLMAFLFGKHSAAALVHYSFLLALVLAVVSYGRRIGYPVAGLAAGLLVYASPVVGIDGTSAYIDVAVACILFAVFYFVQLWDAQRSTGLLMIAGLLAGFAYAAKYTAILALPYAAVYVFWRTRKIVPVALVTACALVLIAPWVIKDVVWAGNPVAPMFNRWFPNPWVHISFEHGWTQSLALYDLPSRIAIPMEAAVRGGKLGGLLGPIFLLIPLGLFALRIQEGRRILAAAALFTLPYFANIGTRFLIPALPFYALSLALVLTEMRLILATVVIAHCILSWPSVARTYASGSAWRLGRVPAKQALRIESEQSWLGRKQPDYAIARLFEEKTPAGSRILAMNGTPEAYTNRTVLVRFQSGEGETMGDIFFAAFAPDFQPRCAERFQFAPREVRKIRAVETGPGVAGLHWSIHEFRVYQGRSELARRPEWRLTAQPNPWEAQLAFDNSPVTRWQSWQPFEPGMFVEVDFGRLRTIDAVQLEGPTDCSAHSLRLDGLTADGKWTTLDPQRDISPLDPSPFMGKAAMRELKQRGIDYLFLRDTDFGAADVIENPEAWGLSLAGQASGGRLYRIDAGYPRLETGEHAILSRP